MSKIKTIKLQEDIDIRNIVIPLILYLETKKNYIVQIQETDNGYSLQCKSKGWWKSLIGVSVKFCMLLEKKEGNVFVSYDKFNFIYKNIILILGVCFCFDQDVFTFGAFLIVTSLYGSWLYLWHKILISFYIKKCIKKKGEVLTENMLNNFSSYLKVIELYKTNQECEEKLLSLKKCETSKAVGKIGEVVEETVIEPDNNKPLKQKIKKPINKEKIKKNIQFIIGVILIVIIVTIYFKYKQETATHASEPQNVEKSNVNDCK